jgi:hypothetical protein
MCEPWDECRIPYHARMSRSPTQRWFTRWFRIEGYIGSDVFNHEAEVDNSDSLMISTMEQNLITSDSLLCQQVMDLIDRRYSAEHDH